MSTSLHELYQSIEDEFGKCPLVVFPAEFNEDSRGIQSYWIVFESYNGGVSSREIVWLFGGVKDISEAEGPSDTSCPLYFFELVPNATAPNWRRRVKWYWLVSSQPESEQDSAWEAYNKGFAAYSYCQKDKNPHAQGTFNHTAWSAGWDHASSIL